MRSPLAYPLSRPVDGDAGGAADLQTDIMRFMAILALCLVAIFALVQSLPLAPEPVPQPVAREPASVLPAATEPETVPPVTTEPARVEPPPVPPAIEPATAPLVLTRSRPAPRSPTRAPEPAAQAATTPQPATEPVPPAPAADSEGFTLSFESDHALTRLVAAGRVGFYAIGESRTRRMMVTDSRLSFWDASTPNEFHEMEAATVPNAVVTALAQSGADAGDVRWGVTLPAGMRREVEALMAGRSGGDLVIRADGSIAIGAAP
ncbi:MAG: hypothetical protein R3176_02330 [Woeseiaceae bacterium]|nr:hypothetical protein [Woeseiaceae bacterium]